MQNLNRKGLSPLLIFALILTCCLYSSCQNKKQISFDSKLWKTDTLNRYQMFDDIVRRRVALGKTFNEVIASFGHPDRKWDSLGRWEYRAGEGTAGLGFGFYTLLLKFRNGVVDSVFTAEYID